MIAFLRGKLIEKHPNEVIVETGGVGYDVQIPISTFSALPDTGSEIQLRIYTHVREDTLALFGFLTRDEKAVFQKLILVSGIGPSLAIKVLSGLATSDLISAIRSGQVEQLVRIPGVGRKTADRIVLELKDKLDGIGGTGAPVLAQKPVERLGALDQDVLSALLNLGCKTSAAEAAVRAAKVAGAPDEFEPLFRKALELVR